MVNIEATLIHMGFRVDRRGSELILKHMQCTGCKSVPNTSQAFGIALNWLAQSQKVSLDRAHKALEEALR